MPVVFLPFRKCKFAYEVQTGHFKPRIISNIFLNVPIRYNELPYLSLLISAYRGSGK